jgi:hypothetical protein
MAGSFLREHRLGSHYPLLVPVRTKPSEPSSISVAGASLKQIRRGRPVRHAPHRTDALRDAHGQAALVGALGFAAAWLLRSSAETVAPLRFAIDVPSSFGLTRPGANRVLSVSPDGRRIAFTAARVIWVWSAETGKLQRLADTVGARAPFFSHDGREIGFFTSDELRRIPATGGLATTIARAPGGGSGAWAADDMILYQLNQVMCIGAVGLLSVGLAAQGSEPQQKMQQDKKAMQGAMQGEMHATMKAEQVIA